MSKEHTVVMQTGREYREQWNRLVLKAPEGTFFHSFDWAEVIGTYGEKTGFFKPRHVSVIDIASNDIVGVLPLFLDRERRLVSLPFGDYGGPCLIPGANKHGILTLLLENAEGIAKKEASEIRLKSLPEEYSDRLRALQFEVHPFMYTFLLPVNGYTIEHIWRGFRRDTKRGIKKAGQEGVVIEEVVEKGLMKEYYQIYAASAKDKTALRPFLFFELLWDLLSPKGALRVLLARHKGEYIAGLIFFSWKEKLHIYANVSLPEYRNLRPNDLLYYEAIRWGVRLNSKVVDFGLTSLGHDSGLYQFKERWGGSPKLLFLTSKSYGYTGKRKIAMLLRKAHSYRMWDLIRSKLIPHGS